MPAIPPNTTLFVKNINTKVKKPGTLPLLWGSS